MSKEAIPLLVADITPFARALSLQLKEADALPSHLGLLNMLARAAGFRNYQHMRASGSAKARLEDSALPADFKRVEKTLQQFDAVGRLIRWPSKRYVQELCLWALWSQLPRGEVMQERDVNGLLNKAHLFEDAAILRRSLIGQKLVSRNADGTDYRRIEQSPSADAIAVIRAVSARRP
ncbi:DUF2087 domain-containing protein [Sulfitobacter pacificus]|uniref:DUF2087 domain-containing protein n=1 Tax=Sulfitobacter pacificus TaxID=1499314 RepID=A0ABQ5VCJ9_9RHOB|nr:DUF2087 domain-containing protein [Sulfitobacter pacificus]GLQ25218.1 hypothetical protein GCM10007927_00210 [Sulfitobacter pacificus]